MWKQIEFTEEELQNEQWKIINLPEGELKYLYEVSNLGRIRRPKKRGGYKYLKAVNRNGGGHFASTLVFKDLGKKIYYIHRIVAHNFIENPDPENKTVVNHKDENSANNRAKNLAWLTSRENTLYGTAIERKSIPVEITDLNTGETFLARSINQASELFGISRKKFFTLINNIENDNLTTEQYSWKKSEKSQNPLFLQ